jgi:hypothetical protein
MYSVCYFCSILTKIGIRGQMLNKIPKYEISREFVDAIRSVLCRQMDRHDGTLSLFLTCEFKCV